MVGVNEGRMRKRKQTRPPLGRRDLTRDPEAAARREFAERKAGTPRQGLESFADATGQGKGDEGERETEVGGCRVINVQPSLGRQ